MIVRAKSPLRLGLAGGGTDIDQFSNKYGGIVINATINMYAHCTLETYDDKTIIFDAQDISINEKFSFENIDSSNHVLLLHYGVYKRIIKDFNNCEHISIKMITYADAPQGSGLGTSSALVVAMIKAFAVLLNLPLGEYDIAHLAYEIERVDLKLSGGKQDQYAATFGGFNYIEFYNNDHVIVNPLRIRKWIKDELEESILLFFTGKSRFSSKIIDDQINNVGIDRGQKYFDAMNQLKKSAIKMKEHILKGNVPGIAEELNKGWEAKKKTSNKVTSHEIDQLYSLAIQNGAIAGKISGAGGGGFMMFIVNPNNKQQLKDLLSVHEGYVRDVEFVERGTVGWYL